MLLSVCVDTGRPWGDLLTLARHAENAGLERVRPRPFHALRPVGGRARPGARVLDRRGRTRNDHRTDRRWARSSSETPIDTPQSLPTWQPPWTGSAAGECCWASGRGGSATSTARTASICLTPVSNSSASRRPSRSSHCCCARTCRTSKALTTGSPRLAANHHPCKDRSAARRGAGERRTIPLAARYADAWHTWAAPLEFQRKNEILDEACVAAGRARPPSAG